MEQKSIQKESPWESHNIEQLTDCRVPMNCIDKGTKSEPKVAQSLNPEGVPETFKIYCESVRLE